MSIIEDWNMQGTVERCLNMSGTRNEFIGLLEEANRKGFLETDTLKRIKAECPKTSIYAKIIEWFYS